ncbi:hypothetical protein KM043_012509 [Ampulex compressa]|nr:hypothetical protein KM043_012509 [Ampulex compressa]
MVLLSVQLVEGLRRGPLADSSASSLPGDEPLDEGTARSKHLTFAPAASHADRLCRKSDRAAPRATNRCLEETGHRSDVTRRFDGIAHEGEDHRTQAPRESSAGASRGSSLKTEIASRGLVRAGVRKLGPTPTRRLTRT